MLFARFLYVGFNPGAYRKDDTLKQYGLIGYPLGHSLSAEIHRQLMRLAHIDGTYRLIEVTNAQLQSVMTDLKGYNGFNVTIPHKMDIIPFLDACSDRAALYGAVNTVKLTGEKAQGYNTDCFGFLRSLQAAGIPLAGRVLICGAGGVSRMFAYEAVQAGAQVTVAARNVQKAQGLADEIAQRLNREVQALGLDQISGSWDLIVNGTPVGMFPNINACVLDEQTIKSASAVFDAIYNPAETLLLKTARHNGQTVLNGLPMLVWQAAVAQEIWNDISFSAEQVREVISITERKMSAI